MADTDFLERAIRNALVPAINDLEEQVAHLTAAVEYLAGRVPQDDFELPDAEEARVDKEPGYDIDYPSEAADHLARELDGDFTFQGMKITVEDDTLVIDTSRESFTPTPEWKAWTSDFFGKGKPGKIEYETIERDDEDDLFIPQRFRLPLAEFDEVFDDD